MSMPDDYDTVTGVAEAIVVDCLLGLGLGFDDVLELAETVDQ